jgi:hypothetical protein
LKYFQMEGIHRIHKSTVVVINAWWEPWPIRFGGSPAFSMMVIYQNSAGVHGPRSYLPKRSRLLGVPDLLAYRDFVKLTRCYPLK